MLLMTSFTQDARVTKEANSLIKDGHSVVVTALKSFDTPSYEKKGDIEIQRIHLKTRYSLPKGNFFFFIKYIEYVVRNILILRRQGFDVFHANDLETLPIAFILSRLNKCAVVYDSHELYTETGKHSKAARFVWYTIEKALVKNTKYIIHENETRAKVFAERYNVPMPVAVSNCQYLNFHLRHNFLRERFEIPDTGKIVLYQGEIAKSRGVDILLDVMNFLDNNRWLIIIGPGDFLSELRRLREQHLKKERIIILDGVAWEELWQYTASADLGVALIQNVCLSYYSSLPNKLFEYLSAGLPVVFCDFPEVRRIVQVHNVGLVVDETNPFEIAQAIDKILNDDALYATMAENAKRIVTEKYNWDIESQKLLVLYQEIAQSMN